MKKGNVEFLVVSEKMQVYDDRSYHATGAPLENYRLVPYEQVQRPIFPLDEEVEFVHTEQKKRKVAEL